MRTKLTRTLNKIWLLLITGLLVTSALHAQPYKEGYFSGLNINGKRITGITDVASGSPLENLITDFRLQQALTGLSLGSGNKMEVFNVRDYSAVPDVVVPATGASVTGTNNMTAFRNCYNATPRGGIMFVPPGNWRVEGGLGTWNTKEIVFIQLGNVYTNATNYITLGGPGGADRGWSIIILGKIIGRVNVGTNSPTTRANGTSPLWSAYTGTGITLLPNVNNSHIKVKWIEGMCKAIEIQGGGGGGSQENTIVFERFWYNAIGISLKNTDGLGWVDKNHFGGWDYGTARITGGLCVKIDGFSGAASTNGEVYNGAFRSNVFHFLAERVDSLIQANGDITYNKFDITIEGGSTTGVLAQSNIIVCRTASPNPMRNTFWTGQGVLGDRWITSATGNSLGLDGTIEWDVYYNSSIFIGTKGTIDGTGNIIMECPPTLSLTTRNALPANLKVVNRRVPKGFRTITATTGGNTSADAEGVIRLNNASMVFTATSASTNVGVSFRLINLNASAATISGITGISSLAQNKGVEVTCDGSTFIAITN